MHLLGLIDALASQAVRRLSTPCCSISIENICTWSVGSQAWRQPRAALQSGSLTHAKICGPHFCTIRKMVAGSCE